jgi:hypothetical protein
VPFTTGGAGHVAVPRSPNPYLRRVGFDELDGGRIYSADNPLKGSVPGLHDRLDPVRVAAASTTLHHLKGLSSANPGRSPVVHLALPQAEPTQLLHGRLFGMRQSKATQWIHVLLPVLPTPCTPWGMRPTGV